MHTQEQVAAMKRQELQSAAAQRFGKDASRWLLCATNQELREALLSGEVPTRFTAVGNGGDLAAAIATAIQPLIAGRLDEDRVNELIDQRLAATQPTTEVIVRRPDGTTKHVGVQHKSFPTLVKWAGLRKHSYLVGPAGTGKTTAAEKLADALGLTFHGQSMCLQTSKSDIFGFVHAGGSYVPGFLYRPMKEGGVVLIDEIDRCNPGVLVAMNSALANGFCLFPNGELVRRHADCVFVAAGNTIHGATHDFNAAQKQDLSVVSRFVRIEWPVDEDLERALAPDQGEWVSYVQELRRLVANLGIRSLSVTPRAALDGADALRNGMSREDVEQGLIWAALPEQDAAKLRANLRQAA
jgi:MoxR-like ATPase